ncbi:hypothetical protein K435DRAFT_880248 [Dendrothele bispora CBS 962.96]|uniref:Uncharacterized protein n=1 Tax=Dendrothele bispora (strain CBS 962.96) TaxID=1314807 RepID=A0A4S8KJU2_DENBC|nr:hypothetical protein K435DRAFT_880248 [Dendrothele bispora CBS 962.96]
MVDKNKITDTCLITQSDPGSENFCLAKGHTFIRQALDSSLHGTLQHRWMREKKTIPPEILWSNLRRRWTPGFEDILESSNFIERIRYDPKDPLQYNVFKWIFIPWIQQELDAYATRINSTRKRHQKDKILPQGAPDDIEEFPEEFGCLDFHIQIDPNAEYILAAESLYAPPDHPVFQLVPAEFDKWAKIYYEELGRPVVNRAQVWSVYMALLEKFEGSEGLVDTMGLTAYDEEGFQEHDLVAHLDNDLGNYAPLQENADGDYLGGVNGGLGDEGMWDSDAIDGYVDFSDDEAEIGAVMRDTYVDPERDSDADVTAVASHLLQYSDDDV